MGEYIRVRLLFEFAPYTPLSSTRLCYIILANVFPIVPTIGTFAPNNFE